MAGGASAPDVRRLQRIIKATMLPLVSSPAVAERSVRVKYASLCESTMLPLVSSPADAGRFAQHT